MFANFSYYLGNFITKLILVNGVATGLGWIVDKIFKV